MSADDQMIVSYQPKRQKPPWIVFRVFVSDEDHSGYEARGLRFASFSEAYEKALAEGAEYGVRLTGSARTQLGDAREVR